MTGAATGEPKGLGMVRFYPNPASDWLTVDCSAATATPEEIQVFDANEKLVFSEIFGTAGKKVLSLEHLAAGVYQVLVKFKTGRLTRSVIKV